MGIFKIDIGKLLAFLIFILTINSVLGQTKIESKPKLFCEQLTGNTSHRDSIKVLIQTKTDDTICYQISLEKKTDKGWILYTTDVLHPVFSKPPIPCSYSKNKRIYSFLINEPELFEIKQSGRISAVKGNAYEIGSFRLKIIYGSNSDDLSEALYLPEFRIQEPTRKK